jgi:PIN domain nuclease of toxin-antitoxin system
VIQLDTHVAVWIATGQRERLSKLAYEAIKRGPPTLSPIVLLELQILREIGRITESPEAILDYLRGELLIVIGDTSFEKIVDAARPLTWTRDPFDRLIAASAIAEGAALVTADRMIRRHLPDAIW